MIWVLLQSESPWQRNDAITFFIYLCVSLLLVVFFHGMKQQIQQNSKHSIKQMKTNKIKHKIRPSDGAKTGKLRGEADIELRAKKTLPNQAKDTPPNQAKNTLPKINLKNTDKNEL